MTFTTSSRLVFSKLRVISPCAARVPGAGASVARGGLDESAAPALDEAGAMARVFAVGVRFGQGGCPHPGSTPPRVLRRRRLLVSHALPAQHRDRPENSSKGVVGHGFAARRQHGGEQPRRRGRGEMALFLYVHRGWGVGDL